MNLITWNVRGLGRPAKRFLVKDFLLLHFADVCCLQESKLEEISPTIWREIGGGWLDQFFSVPAHGTAGGIIIGWNIAIMSAKLLKLGTFSLTVEFLSFSDNLSWRCTSVYGPNDRKLKPAFW
ncbi:Exodeoxyribonuclease III protein [Dioscorea alata]|uniref:Exodeoxyribonuclease III protein n=1 Tax=Dioscorea alata TaxID=55571 RepID=A0ACB7UP41_DIOAL|nr:Exodeoxyribonuclease III protein [Dioscorea alata]